LKFSLEGYRVAIITVSDRSFRGEREDKSGPLLKEKIEELGGEAISLKLVPDEKEEVKKAILELIEEGADLILTTGGTGFSPRDVTPEATKEVIEREAPGLSEHMRRESFKKTPHALLSRGISGIRGESLIINLPGSPNGALENFLAVLPALPHGLRILKGKGEEGEH
jgi:molybdenum cofactor synthesis domain-containing protein